MKKDIKLINLLILFLTIITLTIIGCDNSDEDDNSNEIEKQGELVIRMDGSIVTSDSEYDFGLVEIGSTAEKNFVISNDGDGDLNFGVENWTLIWDSGFNVKIGDNEEGQTIQLQPGQTKSMTISFTPPIGSTAQTVGKLTLNGDDYWYLNLAGQGKVTIEPLSPPAWIQGVWKNTEIIVYVFTSDNITYASNGSQVFDAKASNEYNAAYGIVGTCYYDNVWSATEYELSSKSNNINILNCKFGKISETTLNYSVNSGPNVVLTKQ